MLCMVMPLSVALLPTGHGDWLSSNNGKIPTVCGFRNLAPSDFKTGLFTTPTMIVPLIIFTTSYATRAVRLFPNTAYYAHRWLRTKP